MSDLHMPAEMLDHIVDFLHGSEDALRSCCLVSKSWIPRTRKHLFANVEFRTAADLRSWKITFPDPCTSPAWYTKTLHVGCPQAVTAADAKRGGWIPAFSRVEHLEVDLHMACHEAEVSLIPFYGLSPALKSLRVTASYLPLQIFDLIYSFPPLDDLSVIIHDMSNYDSFLEEQAVVQPSSPPSFTGSLQLFVRTGLNPIASPLLSLPNGLNFRKLDFVGYSETDFSLATALAERCRDTLESIHCHPTREEISDSIDLTRATKLTDVAFGCDLNPEWIVMTLRTVTGSHQNLQQISITTSYVLHDPDLNNRNLPSMGLLVESARVEWLKLDGLLVQLWESHSIRPKVVYLVPKRMDGNRARSCVDNLLPEATKKGIVDFTEQAHGW